jgi:hypothetical protein
MGQVMLIILSNIINVNCTLGVLPRQFFWKISQFRKQAGGLSGPKPLRVPCVNRIGITGPKMSVQPSLLV